MYIGRTVVGICVGGSVGAVVGVCVGWEVGMSIVLTTVLAGHTPVCVTTLVVPNRSTPIASST
jgi:hypothetical protein